MLLANAPQVLDLGKVFIASPVIYSTLLALSVSAAALWLYTLLTFRSRDLMPAPLLSSLKAHLADKQFTEALVLCQANPALLSSIVSAGLLIRSHGSQVMVDAMKSEGKRMTTPLWQRLSLLNDIAVVSPMIGLLGTVIGMFYAFYDINRSAENINALFDGLGIAVGTTVAGLIVAILAMVFATTLKHKILRNLTRVEQEALLLSAQIDCTERT